MNCLIVDFWRRCDGPVHPDDAEVLASNPHSLNLDYPPPAYIGDPRTAPVVLLNANGGYNDVRTPSEFLEPKAKENYLRRLHDPRAESFATMPVYYKERDYWDLLIQGRLVLVNAMAYRSRKISEESENRRIAGKLPSVMAHRHWLLESVLPDVKAGKRIIVAHRHRLWKLPPMPATDYFIQTRASRSPNLNRTTLMQIDVLLGKIDGRKRLGM